MQWSSYAGSAIYLDTNIIILSVETGNDWAPVIRDLFHAIDEDRVRAFTSELTLAEVLAKPMTLGARDLITRYRELLAPDSRIRMWPVDRIVLESAAAFQGQFKIKLLDAIHVATAKHSGCDYFLTQDKVLGKRIAPLMPWLKLEAA
jgi:uncharacterized protein